MGVAESKQVAGEPRVPRVGPGVWHRAAILACVCVAYFLLARWGLSFAAVESNIPSPVWPANGVALAAVYWLSWPAAIAVFLAGLAANLLHAHPTQAALTFSSANAACALLGGLLIRGGVPGLRFMHVRAGLDRTADAARLACVALGSALLGGLGVAVVQGGWARWSDVFSAWTSGDALGQLAIAPMLLVLPALGWPRTTHAWVRLLVGLIVPAATAAGRFWGLSGQTLPQQAITGSLVLTAFAAGPLGVALALPAILAIATLSAGSPERPQDLINLQASLAFSSLVGLLVASTVSQRDRSARAARNSDSERQARERLAEMADAMPQLVWRARPDGVPDYYNARVSEFDGFTRDPATGEWNWAPCVHPDDMQRTLDTWDRARELGTTYRCEHRIRVASGEFRWMLSRAEPVRDQSGRIVRWYGTATDIHELKDAQDALRDMLSSLVESSPFGVYVVDSDFRLIRVSTGAQRVFANVRPLLGRDFADVLRTVWTEPFASEAIAIFRRTLETGEPFHSPSTREARADVPAVESYDWKVERIAMPDGRFGVVCHFYDLSERTAFEDALKRHRAELEEELARRGEEIKRMLTQSAMLDRMAAVGTLAAGLGHDLGNLLLPISVSAETLRRSADSPESRDAAESILRSMDYVRSLVRGLRLFTLGSDSSGPIGAARTDPEDWARQAGPFFAHAAASAGRGVKLDLRVEPRTPAIGIDPASLSQAVLNLVQNAADALYEHAARAETPAGPAASIRVRVGPGADAATVVLRVEDDGPGMSPDVLARCTEPYYTTKTRGVRTGTGLGLALVHETARRVGGACEIESSPGAGTRVTLKLPAAVEADHVQRPVAAVELGDPAWRRLGASLLASSGFAVRHIEGDQIPADAALVVTDRVVQRIDELQALIQRVGTGRVVVVAESGQLDGVTGAVSVAPGPRTVELVRAIRGAVSAARPPAPTPAAS